MTIQRMMMNRNGDTQVTLDGFGPFNAVNTQIVPSDVPADERGDYSLYFDVPIAWGDDGEIAAGLEVWPHGEGKGVWNPELVDVNYWADDEVEPFTLEGVTVREAGMFLQRTLKGCGECSKPTVRWANDEMCVPCWDAKVENSERTTFADWPSTMYTFEECVESD